MSGVRGPNQLLVGMMLWVVFIYRVLEREREREIERERERETERERVFYRGQCRFWWLGGHWGIQTFVFFIRPLHAHVCQRVQKVT